MPRKTEPPKRGTTMSRERVRILRRPETVLSAFLALSSSVLLSSCGVDPQVPVVQIGGGGVKLMTDAKTPYEAYDFSYSSLTREHLRVKTLLKGGAKNHSGAASTLETIAEHLRTMQALVAEPAKSGLAPYIAKYRTLAADAGAMRLPAGWESQIDLWEREVRSSFSPSAVAIPEQWPPGLGPAAKESPAPAPDEAGFRVAQKAWKASVAEIVQLYGAAKDASAPGADAKAALAEMIRKAPGERGSRLELMRQVLEKLSTSTSSFAAVPEGGTREGVLWELGKIAETVESAAAGR